VSCDGDELEISPTEFTLLQVLMENQDKVVRKQVLMREVWGFDFETNTSVLDTYISYLRKKLPDKSQVQIKTIRGVGFKIEAVK
jgi:two-component system OmpR family response regulator